MITTKLNTLKSAHPPFGELFPIHPKSSHPGPIARAPPLFLHFAVFAGFTARSQQARRPGMAIRLGLGRGGLHWKGHGSAPSHHLHEFLIGGAGGCSLDVNSLWKWGDAGVPIVSSYRENKDNWLVVWTPLKNISHLGWLFPIYGKIKNGPNHQPDKVMEVSMTFSCPIFRRS